MATGHNIRRSAWPFSALSPCYTCKICIKIDKKMTFPRSGYLAITTGKGQTIAVRKLFVSDKQDHGNSGFPPAFWPQVMLFFLQES